MGINERIAEAIRGSGKTKAEISRACGVSNAAVTHWFTGDTQSLKGETAVLLEAATGYRAQWLLFGKGPKKVSAWPFTSVDLDQYFLLSDQDKVIVERTLAAAIAACDTPPSPPAAGSVWTKGQELGKRKPTKGRKVA